MPIIKTNEKTYQFSMKPRSADLRALGGVIEEAPEGSADKVQQILAAARAIFMRHGYAAASMDAVARQALVSKATLYVYFANKQELFASVILEERARYAPSFLAGELGREAMPAKLLRFGRALVGFLLSAEIVASCRLVIAEAERVPGLGQSFYTYGPARLLERLEQFVARAMATGLLRTADARVAAEQFIDLVRGDLQLRALLGLKQGLTPRARDAVIRHGVEAFYRAYEPAPRAVLRKPRS
jgi:TetR/AcrR family transcriptional regulator, mexJK operon transcriptional repressor